MKKIAIVGVFGKMGQILEEKLSQKYEIRGIDAQDDLFDAIDCDLVIDFSNGKNSKDTAVWCKKFEKPLIIGATGQTKREINIIKNCSKNIPILKAGNFSMGIQMLKKMLMQIDKSQIESISIIEKHHKNKIDRPSGTALELQTFCEENLKKIAEICDMRGGEEIGTHEVNIYLKNEVLRITHQAFSRDAFARGVEMAAEFMIQHKEKGLFSFDDVINLKN